MMRSNTAAMPGVFDYEKMASLFESKGLTNRAVAEVVGANQITVARWAKGEAVPSPSFIARLAEALEVDPAQLYKLKEAARGLAYYRVLAGYSLAQLAPKVGTSPVHLGRMEAGHSAIPDHVRERLQTLLDLDDDTMERAVHRSRLGHGRLRKPKKAPVPVRVELIRGERTQLIGASA
jgi:transcriptional regulator with XRE-family HTH domain